MSRQSFETDYDSTYRSNIEDVYRSRTPSVSQASVVEDTPSYYGEHELTEGSLPPRDTGSDQGWDSTSQFGADQERRGEGSLLIDGGSVLGEAASLQVEQVLVGEGFEEEKVPSEIIPHTPEEVDPLADIPVTIKDNMKYMSFSQLRAARYLKKRHIFEFFNYLLGHLLSASPSDPISFLNNLLDKCITYRDGGEVEVEPPLMFTKQHIQILYKAFDPIGVGFLTMDQYRSAMMTMGITDFREEFSQEEMGKVSQETFCDEAERCLLILFNEMIRIHRRYSLPTVLPGEASLPTVQLPGEAATPDDVTEYAVEYDGEGNAMAAPPPSEEYGEGAATPMNTYGNVAEQDGGWTTESDAGGQEFDGAEPRVVTYGDVTEQEAGGWTTESDAGGQELDVATPQHGDTDDDGTVEHMDDAIPVEQEEIQQEQDTQQQEDTHQQEEEPPLDQS